jgi:antitoxin VapB
MDEFNGKTARLRTILIEQGLDGLLLQRVSSFAWATCGAASFVNTAATEGVAFLLVTHSELHLITNNIEAPRMEKEERLREQGWEFHVYPWHEAPDIVSNLTHRMKLGADGPYDGAKDLSAALARQRARLTLEEGDRMRELGSLCSEAMHSAVQAIRPGMTEHEISGRLSWEAESRGVQAIVNLIATDERIFNYRHPLPTDKKLDRYAMLVLCGRRWGLVCSITRLVHFGKLSDEVRHKAEAVAKIDATLIAATRPGRRLADVFQQAISAYAESGFADEWRLHHQGGPAGYEPREYIITPGSEEVVYAGQAYAWNPSITGTKSEDTILVGERENEVLTAVEGWPTTMVSVGGFQIARPTILEMA